MPGKGKGKGSGGSRRSLHKDEFLDAVKRRLGLARGEYHSSEDEDYAPSTDRRPCSARQSPHSKDKVGAAGNRPGRTVGQASTLENLSSINSPAVSEKEAAGVEEAEELTLSQRRAQLKRRRTVDGVAEGPASPALRRQLEQQQQQQRGGQAARQMQKQQGASVHLPAEVLERVLQLAAANGAVPVLPIAACVCKAWKAAVVANPHLWHTVDLSSPGCRPSHAVIAWLSSAGSWAHLVHLSLSGCERATDASLRTLAEHCPRLASLDLSYCTKFTEAGLTGALKTMLLRRRSGSCGPLRRLNLSCIQVSPKMSGTDHLFRQVLMLQSQNQDGPVLEELQMEGCPLLTHQGLRAACDSSVEQCRPLLGALRMLRLTQSAGARSGFFVNIERLQYACPSLEEFGINGLCGRMGWDFNPQPPAALPHYALPAAAESGAAAMETDAAAGSHGQQMHDEEALAAAHVDIGGVGAPVAHQQLADSQGAAGDAEDPMPLGFPALRVCELRTTILHSEGRMSGASNLTPDALRRIISQSPLLEDLDLSGTGRLGSAPETLASTIHPASPLRRLRLARSALCRTPCVADVVRRHCDTLELVDFSWGAHICDSVTPYLSKCPRLTNIILSGTAITDGGVATLLGAAVGRGQLGQLRLDISSCRSVSRGVRQAALQGMQQLAGVLGVL